MSHFKFTHPEPSLRSAFPLSTSREGKSIEDFDVSSVERCDWASQDFD